MCASSWNRYVLGLFDSRLISNPHDSPDIAIQRGFNSERDLDVFSHDAICRSLYGKEIKVWQTLRSAGNYREQRNVLQTHFLCGSDWRWFFPGIPVAVPNHDDGTKVWAVLDPVRESGVNVGHGEGAGLAVISIRSF